MKLSTRLTIGFGLSTLLGLVIAAFGTLRINDLSDNIHDLAHRRMLQIEQFSTIKDNLNAVARYTRNIAIKPDPEYVNSELSKVADSRAKIMEAIGLLDKSLQSAPERALFQTIIDKRDTYNQLIDRTVQLAQVGQGKELSETLMGPVRDTQNVMFSAVSESIKLQIKIATELSDTAMEHAAATGKQMFALAMGFLALGVVVSRLMVRNLRITLGAEPVEVNTVMERIAKGDLATRVPVPVGDTSSTVAVLDSMKQSLRGIVQSVRQNAENVSSASVEIASGNQDLAERTSQQASALEQTVAAIAGLSSTVRQSASNAQDANQLALNASEVAKQGGEVVGEVVQTMKGINESSKRIADIISVIDGIAFQTNILALNAAVEAARAGEQGRGFAVVASEVRSLAGRSAEAAKEIKALIDDSVNRVDQGAALVDQAGRTMTAIVDSIQKVTAIVGNIKTAAHEQANGISQINTAITQLDQSTQQNAALVQQSTAAADGLSQRAQELVKTVAAFHLQES